MLPVLVIAASGCIYVSTVGSQFRAIGYGKPS